MNPLWLEAIVLMALVPLAVAIVGAHVEREIVNDGDDELVHRVRWKWK